MRVLVYIDDVESWRDALARRLPDAEIFTSDQNVADMDYLAVWKPPAELLRRHANVRGIVNLGAGVDALLNNPGLRSGIPVAKLRDAGMGPLMADYVRYGILHFQRDFDRYLRQQADARWQKIPVVPKQQWEVGVLGLGAIGSHVARVLSADGFPVHGWSRLPKKLAGIRCYYGDSGLNELLGRVRTLVTLLPDTPATRHIINARTLAALPEGASLINPGRGSLIDEAALLEALGPGDEEGRLRGAVLDAFPEEPLPVDSPLWRHPRISITPHMAAPTPLEEAADQVADILCAWEAGKPVATVDPEIGY